MAKTVGGSTVQQIQPTPVIVRGYRRVFNIQPPHYTPSFRISSRPIEDGAMNLIPDPGSFFNGLFFRLNPSVVARLHEREKQYNRIRVVPEKFDTGVKMEEATTYYADEASGLLCRNPQQLLPRWRDLKISRTAAYRVDRSFGKMFDRTTYLADGQTPVVEHYSDSLPAIPESTQNFPQDKQSFECPESA